MRKIAVLSALIAMGSAVATVSCNRNEQKSGGSADVVSSSEVMQIHNDLNAQKVSLNQAGLSFHLVKSAKYEILELSVVALPGSYSPQQRKQALKALSEYLSRVVGNYSGKYVYFGENPTEVLNGTSKASLEKSLAQIQTLMAQL